MDAEGVLMGGEQDVTGLRYIEWAIANAGSASNGMDCRKLCLHVPATLAPAVLQAVAYVHTQSGQDAQQTATSTITHITHDSAACVPDVVHNCSTTCSGGASFACMAGYDACYVPSFLSCRDMLGTVSDYSLREGHASVVVVRSTTPPTTDGHAYMFATDGSRASSLALVTLTQQ